RVGGREARPPGGRPCLLLVRHRRGGPGLRARDRHARGRWAHLLGGASARQKPPGATARRLRPRRGVAAVRRAGPGHIAPGRQPALRIRLAPGARTLIRGALLAVVLLALAMPASAAAGGPVALVTVTGLITDRKSTRLNSSH